ncbi:MAG: glycosyl transferase [Phormidesmis priestleyi]|uniref:Glycosyl transferase n=1 Tax=Phormidesmis priestleyi TaxID=268141 RepID=A0A2W4XGF2_9CYAN|nr:MAG: glycosyl transferase [Phormidesmis priestleyi]
MTEPSSRIAIYLRLLSGGGAERMMVNLMQGFVELGLSVDLVLNKADGPYLDLIPPQVRIIDLQSPRMIQGLPKLVSYLKREKPVAMLTTLHYNIEIAIVAKLLARANTRLLVREANTLSNQSKYCKTDRWSGRLAKWLYPLADEVLAVSHGVAEDLSKVTGISTDRIKVVYNPVITPSLLENSNIAIDHPWLLYKDVPVVLGVGRLSEQKDFSTLIRAVSQVRQQRPVRLLILGTGPDRELLRMLASDLGIKADVEFLGFVKNPYAYMKQSDVFVLSSKWEGLPNVLIETMAVGTPVISTRCPSGAVEILADGKYGDLVEIGDAQEMAKAILAVLDGEVKFVEAEWLQQFTLTSAIEKYLPILLPA